MTKHRHFILNKPYGYLSQFVYNQPGRKKTKLLGEFHDFPDNTMAIGRLDEKSEGLLFLTTDGKVSELVRSKSVEKEYFVQVDGLIDEVALTRLREGVEISVNCDKYTTLPAKAYCLNPKPDFPERSRRVRDDRHGPTSWISITITEGKFRQVRKMTSAVGFPTLRLVRVRIGAITLDNLADGSVREVHAFDV
jgi:23S rRNA pseudouridine2457 synthase